MSLEPEPDFDHTTEGLEGTEWENDPRNKGKQSDKDKDED
jgi:hypothetical protein